MNFGTLEQLQSILVHLTELEETRAEINELRYQLENEKVEAEAARFVASCCSEDVEIWESRADAYRQDYEGALRRITTIVEERNLWRAEALRWRGLLDCKTEL